METFNIVGAGRVGTTLGFLLNQAGYRPLLIVDRYLSRAEKAVSFIGAGLSGTDHEEAAQHGDFLMLAVPDSAIAGLAESLSRTDASWENRIVFHCSGSLTASVLDPLEKAGAATGSFHPLQTFSHPQTAVKRIRKSWFCLEGSKKFKQLASSLVESLGGNIFEVSAEKKVLYHTAAVFASNFLVVLMDQAAAIMSEAGLPKEEAEKALQPLAEGALSGITESGTVQALTGPVERGDYETVKAHLQVLDRLSPEAGQLYRALSLRALHMAVRKESPDREKIRRLLQSK